MIHIYITRHYYDDFNNTCKDYKTSKMVHSVIELNDCLLSLENAMYRSRKLNVSVSIEVKTDNPVILGSYEKL